MVIMRPSMGLELATEFLEEEGCTTYRQWSCF